jgi:predicted TIM-barrel fold metal-dependent hydrolase
MADTAVLERSPAAAGATQAIIDCDIHPTAKSADTVRKYLPQKWQEYHRTYGEQLRQPFIATSSWPRAAPAVARRDSWPPNGGLPGSDLDFMREQHLDANNVEFGVLQVLFPHVAAFRNQAFAAAMATATNEWQLAEWCEPEPRLRGSIVITPDQAQTAVREIERWIASPYFVQIFMVPRMVEPPGRMQYWPIYEIAEHYNIPIGFHGGGMSGHSVTGAGWPTYFPEEHPSSNCAAQALVTSLVMEGVFERFPKLKVIGVEMGMGWMPSLGWRLDRLWKTMRSEVPEVKTPPSQLIRRNMWITTQPMEEPETHEDLRRLFEWIGWEKVLFATDYPHWDFDDPRYAVPFAMTPQERRMIFRDNAAAVFARS